jgi:hypothetical protein
MNGTSAAADTGATEYMSILSNGNVGIGTTSPSTKLEVVDTFSVQRTSTDNEGLYVTVSGADANAIVQTFYQEDSGALYGFRKRYDGSTNLYQEFIHDYSATGTEVYRVNRSTKNTSILNGNVGIGTTSPAQKLDVVGSIAISENIELGHASDTTITRASEGRIAVEGVNVVTTSSTDTLENKTLASPTLTTPILGTPQSGTLTNCTFPTLNQSTTGNAATATKIASITNNDIVQLTGEQTLTNKILYRPGIQNYAAFIGGTSGTTTFLQATAVAGSTTLTLPTSTDTLVGRNTADTLTNKTLTRQQLQELGLSLVFLQVI